MGIEKLTPAKVRNAKTEGLLSDGGNLYLQITKGTAGNVRKSWIFRYRLNNRTRDMGLGSFDTFGLAEARDEARRCRQLVAKGVDPIAQRDADRARRAQTLPMRQTCGDK